MPHQILYTENYGMRGKRMVYIKSPDSKHTGIIRLCTSLNLKGLTILSIVKKHLKNIFLPFGYPDSVSDDYKTYQIWDTVQAFCSTITNSLTTHAILKSVGVGDETASSLSAAVTWILKDGCGMLSSILFTWLSSTNLDRDCKKWRLFADIVNDAAMFTELLILSNTSSDYSIYVLCCTTSMKAIVGVAGCSTRAAVIQHQAIRENTADVAAKDSSQETLVNFIASFIGIAILSFIKNSSVIWCIFLSLMMMHLYANYMAVRSLQFFTFNNERLNILIYNYFGIGIILPSKEVNLFESVFVCWNLTDLTICGFQIKLGSSLKRVTTRIIYDDKKLLFFTNFYQTRSFMILPNEQEKVVYVPLKNNHTVKDIIQAYFHSVIFGVAISLLSNEQNLISGTFERFPFENCLMGRLIKFTKNELKLTKTITIDAVAKLDSFCQNEFELFWDMLLQKRNDSLYQFLLKILDECWNIDKHQLIVDEWRGTWGKELENLESEISREVIIAEGSSHIKVS